MTLPASAWFVRPLPIACLLGGALCVSSAAVKFELESDYQFQPIELRVNGETNAVRTIRIRGEYDENGIGDGKMTLDSRQGLPNEFGDIVSRGPGPTRELRIKLKRLPVPTNRLDQVGETQTIPPGFERIQITFPNDHVNLALAWIGGEQPMHPHLLLIGSLHNTDEFAMTDDVTFRLGMKGTPAVRPRTSPRPVGESLALSGIYTNARLELRQVIVRTDFSGSDTLGLDPNRFGIGWFGGMGMRTMIGYERIPVSVRPIEITDPLNRGRKLYRIVSENPLDRNEAVLVLGADQDGGDHRLLIYRGETIWTSVRLVAEDLQGGLGTDQNHIEADP